MDGNSSPRRKKDGSPRVMSSTGYTSEDERSPSKHVHDGIMAEFTTNLNHFIDAYTMKNAEETERSSALIETQIMAFKTLKQSIYGDLFIKYLSLSEEDAMRSFYVGCLFQVVHPHTVFTIKHS